MHRHGYKGRKFGREKDQRRALIKGLASSLIDNGSIKTTEPKAKEIIPYVEKLITKAKKGDLHNRRQIIAKLATVDSAHRLVDEIAPKLTGRDSGHLTIKKTDNRRGDNSKMAVVSFVDDIEKPAIKPAPAKVAKKSDDNKENNSKAEAQTDTVKPSSKQPVAPKKAVATHVNKTASRAKGVTKGDR